MSDEPTKENPEDRLGLTPVRRKGAMTGWKNGLEFEQKSPILKKTATTCRFPKRGGVSMKKGNFQKRVKVANAPNLLSVVNAKPEIKQKASSEVVSRFKKKEQKRKMVAKVIVNKPPPKQMKGQWTSVLKPKDPPLTGKAPEMPTKKAVKPKKKTPVEDGDWKNAYQDIVSPQSGKQKMVAKQDLVTDNKLPSPKKKSRKPVPPKPSLPLVSLEDSQSKLETDDVRSETKSTTSSKKSTRSSKVSKSIPVINDDEKDDEDSIPIEPMVRAVTPPLEDAEPAKRPSEADSKPPKVAPVDRPKPEENTEERPSTTSVLKDTDEYVDYASEDDSPVEVESTQRSDDPKRIRSAVPKMKKQLVLEFALPPEDGDEDNGAMGLEVPVEIQSFDDMSSVGSWPSIESNDSYDTKMNKMMQRWMDVHGDCEGEDRTMYDNDVDLEDNVLDHIILAAPDLDEAMAQFEEITGIRPTPVGPLQGLGAKTAHVGLDNNRYLEILAPDDENPGPLGEELKILEPGTLTPYHYSIRSSEVSRLIEGYVYDVLGWDPDHIAMVQALPDNSIRQWDLLTMYGHDVGGTAPCYVKWKDPAQHPTASIALKATLTTFTVRAPEDHDVHKLITGVGGLNVEYGEPLLECTFVTPKGTLTFSANNPKGLVFPGYDDDHQISDMPDLLPVSGEQSIYHSWHDIGSDSESSETNH